MTNWKEYEHIPTIELIELIKMKDNPEHLEKSTIAFSVLCFRFQKSLEKKAVVLSRNYGYDDGYAIEIIERTFKRFWKYPNFRLEKIKCSTPDKGVELYLSRIAQHCFYDLYNERNGINVSPYDGCEEIIYDIPVPDEYIAIDNEKFLIINKALKTFSWKHRVIYLTYLQHELNGYKLPRKLLSELRDKLGITQDTIRFYRFEVINKINEYNELWQQKEKILTKIR
ncbi:MAG: hypothetical protein QM786_06960 [Breznakibacter sp.]